MGLELLAMAAMAGTTAYAASQQPKVPSASKTAQAQNQQNLFNTQLSQASLMNQATPFGSINYTPGAIDPATGLPRYNVQSQLSPENQALLDTQYGIRGDIGSGISGLLGDINLGEAPDLSNAANSLTNQSLANLQTFMEPYYQREDNALQNRLNVQGASDKARQFAEMQQGDNRARNVAMSANTFRNQAFTEALQNYLTPRNTISQMFNLTNPYGQGFQQTPTFSQTAPQMGQLTQDQYSNEYKNYQNLLSGVNQFNTGLMNFPLGTAPGAVPTIGSKIGSGIAGMMS